MLPSTYPIYRVGTASICLGEESQVRSAAEDQMELLHTHELKLARGTPVSADELFTYRAFCSHLEAQ